MIPRACGLGVRACACSASVYGVPSRRQAVTPRSRACKAAHMYHVCARMPVSEHACMRVCHICSCICMHASAYCMGVLHACIAYTHHASSSSSCLRSSLPAEPRKRRDPQPLRRRHPLRREAQGRCVQVPLGRSLCVTRGVRAGVPRR